MIKNEEQKEEEWIPFGETTTFTHGGSTFTIQRYCAKERTPEQLKREKYMWQKIREWVYSTGA